MPTRHACMFVAACVAFAGCASPPPKPVAVAPPRAPATIDGIYRGTSTRFQADSRSCPHPGLVTLYVQDHKFSYRWDYSTWVDSSIDPDGTVHGQADRITLVGKQHGKTLEGDVTNGTCGLHFTTTQHDL
jgi:hypothetical protein